MKGKREIEPYAKLERKIDALAKSVEDLAMITKRGFEGVDKRFEQVNRRFEQVDKRFDRVEERLDKIEYYVSGHERRIEVLEDKMRQVSIRLGLKFN